MAILNGGHRCRLHGTEPSQSASRSLFSIHWSCSGTVFFFPLGTSRFRGRSGMPFVLSTVFGFGTIGVPVLLWLRYKIRSPGVLLMEHSPLLARSRLYPRLEVAKVIRPDSSSCSSGHQYISSAMPSQPAVSTGFGIATPQCFPRPYRRRRKNHNREPFSFVAGSLCSHESFAQYDPLQGCPIRQNYLNSL